MKVLFAFAGLLALAAASAADSYNKKDDYKEPEPHYAGHGAYTYHGKYPGKCSNDGLYFRDEKSFVFCSNGNSYVQPCAPGTRNSAYGKYSYGGKYDYRDFCDVNLVDEGYAAKHAGYGHNNKHGAGYAAPRDHGYAAIRYDAPRDYSYAAPRNYGYAAPRDYAPRGYGAPAYGHH